MFATNVCQNIDHAVNIVSSIVAGINGGLNGVNGGANGGGSGAVNGVGDCAVDGIDEFDSGVDGGVHIVGVHNGGVVDGGVHNYGVDCQVSKVDKFRSIQIRQTWATSMIPVQNL